MLFDKLFYQYKTKFKPTFGSRWMKFHGNLLLGRPENNGLDEVRDDLLSTYYFIKEDRRLPQDDAAALEEWGNDSILVNNFREVEAPEVSRAASITGMIMCLVFVFAGASVNAGKLGTEKLKEKIEKSTSSILGMADQSKTQSSDVINLAELSLAKCNAIALELQHQTKTYPNNVVAKCNGIRTQAELDALRGGQ